MKLIDRLFVPNWRRTWWLRWSTWASTVNAALWTAVSAKTGALLGFLPALGYLPPAWWFPVLAVTFLVVFAIPVLLAAVKQARLGQIGEPSLGE